MTGHWKGKKYKDHQPHSQKSDPFPCDLPRFYSDSVGSDLTFVEAGAVSSGTVGRVACRRNTSADRTNTNESRCPVYP